MKKVCKPNPTLAMPPPRIDIKERFSKIREQYQSPRKSFNCLLYGDAGTGKTRSLLTVRLPLLILQCDPGGATSLGDFTNRDDVVVVDFSGDDPKNPTQYDAFTRFVYEAKKDGLFDQVGTVALDSITTFSDMLMNAIMAANGRIGRDAPEDKLRHGKGSIVSIPELRDYQLQIAKIGDTIGFLTGISADFICIGHIDMSKDEVSGRMYAAPMVTGKLSQKLPLLFDEIYISQTKTGREGTEYFFLTAPDGIFQARSRLNTKGQLALREEPDFKKILKKVGMDATDLEA